MGFRASVQIAGVEARGVTLSGATITYGKTFREQPPTPATAYLTLLPLDVRADLPGGYPGLGFGASIPSGFTDDYRDLYEGGASSLSIGTPVSISLITDDGYTSPRFSGFIAAIDYQPQATSLTLITASESLTRKLLLPAAWPSETEVARVQRIATDAGIPITIEGANTAVLSSYPTGENYVSAWDLLSGVADDCHGLLYTNRTGAVIYRTRAADTGRTMVTLAPAGTLTDTLTMTTEAGSVINSVTVTYPGEPDAGEFTVEDADSIQKYGKRSQEFNVLLVQQSAEAYAQRTLELWKQPVWLMPQANVIIKLADDHEPGSLPSLMEIDLDDEVALPQLLPSSPVPSYASRVLGYTETLDPTNWALTFALDPFGWTWKTPGDAPPPPPVVGPSQNPSIIPLRDPDGSYVRGKFKVVNYDGNLTYVTSPLAGSTGTADLDLGSGVFTVTNGNASWSVATTVDGSIPATMTRKQYTFHTEDHGWWETRPVTIPGGTYPATARQRDVYGDPAVDYGNGWQCPAGWWPQGGTTPPTCMTLETYYTCDNGGTLSGSTCTLPPTQGTENVWVSNPVSVRDATPSGFIDTGDEWVRTT